MATTDTEQARLERISSYVASLQNLKIETLEYSLGNLDHTLDPGSEDLSSRQRLIEWLEPKTSDLILVKSKDNLDKYISKLTHELMEDENKIFLHAYLSKDTYRNRFTILEVLTAQLLNHISDDDQNKIFHEFNANAKTLTSMEGTTYDVFEFLLRKLPEIPTYAEVTVYVILRAEPGHGHNEDDIWRALNALLTLRSRAKSGKYDCKEEDYVHAVIKVLIVGEALLEKMKKLDFEALAWEEDDLVELATSENQSPR